jgi:uncharacterized protein YhhL (DUF1145 family)
MFSRYFEFPFALCIFIDPMIVVCIFCFAMQLLLHGRLLKNQTPNNTNSTTSNNKTSVEEVAQLDGKNHTYSLPADLQPPNATQDYIIVHCFSRNVEIFVHIFQDFLF